MATSIKFYVYVSLVELWIVFGTKCSGCPTSSGSVQPKTTPVALAPDEQILASIQDAIAQMRDGVVTLRQSIIPSSQPPPNVVRTEKGMTANFTCDLITGPIGGNLVWHHRNRIINTSVIAPVTNKSFFYSHGRTQETSYLFIHNITADATGPVECFIQNGANTSSLVKQYHLIPKLLAEDVFVSAMKNISTKYWKFAFTCRTAINCHSGADEYFVWRYGGQFLKSPTNHYINIVRGYYPLPVWSIQFSSAVSEEQNTCEMTMSVELFSTMKLLPATAECWVRTLPASDEWYIQTARVQFE